jgi:T5SS/PEP-CTERM-associated repeat protein
LAVADLNHDGWLGQLDIVAFMNGERPDEQDPVEDIVPEHQDWHDASSWMDGSVPDEQTDVVLTSLVQIGDADAVARDVTVTEGAGLRLAGGNLAARTVTVHEGATLILDDESSVLSVETLVLQPGAVLEWNGGVIEIAGGSYIQSDVDLIVGDRAMASTLRLLDEATALIARDTFIGMDPGDVGFIEVIGSMFETGRTLYAGFAGKGWLEVSDGGLALGEDAYVGFLPDGIGTMVISGAGSQVALAGRLKIGDAGYGELQLFSGGVVSADEILIGDGGHVIGAGTLEGPVVNQGRVLPAGTLQIVGSYEQDTGGELAVELRSDGHDRLLITGSASLAGTLRVELAPDFEAAAGASYDLVRADSQWGRFESVKLPELGGSMYFAVEDIPDGVRVVAMKNVDPTARLDAPREENLDTPKQSTD